MKINIDLPVFSFDFLLCWFRLLEILLRILKITRKMDGERVRKYWNKEVKSMIELYQQFNTLVAHTAEDGRYVEELIREYLKKFLPKSLEVLTGFILRPAVKTASWKNKERDGEKDIYSTQLDILVCDTYNYPVFQRFGDSVIVPPESVIGIISVKKHLVGTHIEKECAALSKAAKLCRLLTVQNEPKRGPFTALVSMKSNIKKSATLFSNIENGYEGDTDLYFDECISYIGSFNDFSVTKSAPNIRKCEEARYIHFNHTEGEEEHLGLQLLLTGILSTFYDTSRENKRRPGFTAFEDGRRADTPLGAIPVKNLRENYKWKGRSKY